MSLMTAVTTYDHKSRGVGAIFSAISKDLSSKIRYSQYGFQDFFPDAEDEQLTKWAGPGKGILTGEGVTYGDEQLWRDYPKAPVMRKYTLRLQVTEEQLYWLSKAGTQKQVNQITNMFEGIINGLNYNIDFDAERFWYLGFGTTFYTGGDGLSLFNGSHAIRAGGTQSNLFGDKHRKFSAANLLEMINRLNRLKETNGTQLLPCTRLRVLCSLEAEQTVQQALKSMYGPSTNNLGINAASAEALAQRGIVVDWSVLPYMGTAYKNYWFGVDLERAKDRLFMCWMWKPRSADEETVSNGTKGRDCSAAFGPNCIGHQFTIGSKGDETDV